MFRESTAVLEKLKQTVGVIQHHDAVTGTEKQHVADDYHRRIHLALVEAYTAFSLDPSSNLCLLSNISQCSASELFGEELKVSVYNPLSRSRNYQLRLPVVDGVYSLRDETGALVPSQLLPIPEKVLSIPGRNSSATFEVVSTLQEIAPLSFQNLILTRSSIAEHKPRTNQTSHNRKLRLSGNKLSLTYERGENKFYWFDKRTDTMSGFTLDAMHYRGHRGNNSEFEFRASGAYIFRPDGDDPVSLGAPTSVQEYFGEVVDEVHLGFAEDWVSLVLRLYKDETYLEVDWTVGPIPVEDRVGKEVVLRYSSDIESNGEFVTDSNGRQLMRRIRNFRPTFEINMTEPTAQNYYPVNSKILIGDERVELGVLVDRSQGGGSIQDGGVELMVHRSVYRTEEWS